MHVRILGSAAGGGLPQWNCACSNCQAARRHAPHVRRRTQSSIVVSADGRSWFLFNASADVRQQLIAFADLGPPPGAPRGTSLAGCVLTDAELDHASGLLQLREGCDLNLFTTMQVRRWLNQWFPVEPILAAFARRTWLELPLDVWRPLTLPSGAPSGLEVRAFETGRDAPRYVRRSDPEVGESAAGGGIGVTIRDAKNGPQCVYAPGVAALDQRLQAAISNVDLLLLDGTFWGDDEPARMGITQRTALEMGHVPVSGTHGSLAWLSRLPVRERVYIHINNTNPMLDEQGPEFALVRDCGIRVGMDGDAFLL